MKKILWILLVILCLIFILFGIISIYEAVFTPENISIEKGAYYSPAQSFFLGLVFIVMPILGINKAIKKIRHKEICIKDYKFTSFEIKLKYKIPFNDFFKISLIQLSNYKLKYFLLAIFFSLFYSFLGNADINYMSLLYPILIPALIIWSLYSAVKKNYNNLPYLQHDIEYTLNENRIIVNGLNFTSENNWQHIVKIIETKKYFLLYTSNINAHYINKEFFSAEDEINNFRNFLYNTNTKDKLLLI